MSTDKNKTMDDLLAERAELEEKADLEAREELDNVQEAANEQDEAGPAKPRKGIHIWQNTDGSITVTPIKELADPNLYDMMLMGTFVRDYALSALTAESVMKMMDERMKGAIIKRAMDARGPGGPVA